MPRRRPGALTAAAIMAIIYGSLFTLCNLCGVVTVAAQGAMGQNPFVGGDPKQAQMQKKIEETMERDVPLYRVMQVVAPVVGLVGALALLCAGAGLLRVAGWARRLATAAVAGIILFNILNTIYQAAFLIPAMSNVFDDILQNAQPAGAPPMPAEVAQVMRYSLIAGTVIGVLIQVAVIVYLLVIVLLLMRRNVRAAFAGIDLPEDRPGQPGREGDDEGWGASAPPQRPQDDYRIQ